MWYAATQLIAVHAAWHAAQQPRRNKTMYTFMYNMLPNEFAHVGVLVHAATLVAALRWRASGGGAAAPRTVSALVAVGALFNVAVLALHLRAARRNAHERQFAVEALYKAGIPHRIQRRLSLAAWARLTLLFPLHYLPDVPVVLHRNIPYVTPAAVRSQTQCVEVVQVLRN